MGLFAIGLLGPLTFECDLGRLRCGGPLQRRLTAYLALHANRLVSPDELIEVLWQARGPDNPRASLHVYVAQLRRTLDRAGVKHRLVHVSGAYQFSLRPDETDLARFDRHLGDAQVAVERPDLRAAVSHLTAARELVRGPPLQDLRDVVLAAPEVAELDDRIVGAAQQSFEFEIALGRHREVVPELRRHVDTYPFREGLWTALVLALYRSGRQEEALAQCRQVRRLLLSELGIEPGPTLRQLELDVLRQDVRLATADALVRSRSRRRIDNVPVPLVRPVGRSEDVAVIAGLLRGKSRLVTISGTGGIGKTTVAQLAARTLADFFPDGICWVELGHLTHPRQVPGAVAHAIGLVEQPGSETLDVACAFLQSRRLLLVLDNFEHVLEAWTVVVAMLSAGPDVAVLVTSRRVLAVRGESNVPLEPLPVPRADLHRLVDLAEVPSAQLFLERAEEVNRHLLLSDDDAQDVAAVCRRLNGLPLALELAAAQLRRVSVRALSRDLDRALAEPCESPVDLPSRQRTMTDTIRWSYDLLAEDEREVFEHLGAFAGEVSLQAVAAVCDRPWNVSEVRRVVDALRAQSVVRGIAAGSPPNRVTMLLPIREFAVTALQARADAASIRDRHAEHFLTVAERLAPVLLTHAQVDALAALRADDAELLRALGWTTAARATGATAGTRSTSLRLVGALWHYWELQGAPAQACTLAELAVSDPPSDLDPAVVARGQSGAATLHWLQGHTERSAELHSAALSGFQRARDNAGRAWSLMCCAVQALAANDLTGAAQLARQVVDDETSEIRSRVGALLLLGLVEVYEGRAKQATPWYQEAVTLARQTQDRWLLGVALTNLADSDEQNGRLEEASLGAEEVLRTALELDSQLLGICSVEILAAVELRLRRPKRAARMFGSAETYRTEMGLPPTQPERERLDSLVEQVRTATGPTGFAVAWSAGCRLPLDELAQEILRDRAVASRGDGAPAGPGITAP